MAKKLPPINTYQAGDHLTMDTMGSQIQGPGGYAYSGFGPVVMVEYIKPESHDRWGRKVFGVAAVRVVRKGREDKIAHVPTNMLSGGRKQNPRRTVKYTGEPKRWNSFGIVRGRQDLEGSNVGMNLDPDVEIPKSFNFMFERAAANGEVRPGDRAKLLEAFTRGYVDARYRGKVKNPLKADNIQGGKLGPGDFLEVTRDINFKHSTGKPGYAKAGNRYRVLFVTDGLVVMSLVGKSFKGSKEIAISESQVPGLFKVLGYEGLEDIRLENPGKEFYIVQSGGYLVPLPDGRSPKFDSLAEARKVADALNRKRGGKSYYTVGTYNENPLPPRTLDTMSEAIAQSSPSGRISKRAAGKARDRLGKALFGDYDPSKVEKTQAQKDAGRILQLERQIADNEHYIRMGMRPRVFAKQVAMLKEELALLVQRAENPICGKPTPRTRNGALAFTKESTRDSVARMMSRHKTPAVAGHKVYRAKVGPKSSHYVKGGANYLIVGEGIDQATMADWWRQAVEQSHGRPTPNRRRK